MIFKTTVAHICKHIKQISKHNSMIEAQHNVIGTQHGIIEAQHNVIGTRHGIIKTQHNTSKHNSVFVFVSQTENLLIALMQKKRLLRQKNERERAEHAQIQNKGYPYLRCSWNKSVTKTEYW